MENKNGIYVPFVFQTPDQTLENWAVFLATRMFHDFLKDGGTHKNQVPAAKMEHFAGHLGSPFHVSLKEVTWTLQMMAIPDVVNTDLPQ